MDIGKRLSVFIGQLNIDQKTFAKEIKVSGSIISDIVNGNSPAGRKVIINTLNRFTELSAEWLLRGSGPMIRKSETEAVQFFEEPEVKYITKADLYNFHRLVEKVRELEEIVYRLDKSINPE